MPRPPVPGCCLRVMAAQANRGGAMQIPEKIPDNQMPLSPVDRKIDLLGAESSLHSVVDAEAYVKAILAKYKIDSKSANGLTPLEHRLAVAEYAAITDPSKRIPEARIVDAFNQLMHEWGAEPWTRITVADFHRFHRIKAGILIPYSVSRNADGVVADSCRPVEALHLFFLLTLERGMQSGPKLPDLPENFGTCPVFVQSTKATNRVSNADDPITRRYEKYTKARNAWLGSHFNLDPTQELTALFNLLKIS